MIKYQKTQYGYLLTIIFSIINIAIAYLGINQIGSKPIPLVITVILFVLFLGIMLSFYKLTISIDNEKLNIKFGIGFIKKTFLINEISLIEKIKTPWYYGIGIRLTPKGWLWNVKFGDAIYLQNKNKTTSFLIGTDDADEIIKNLKIN